MKNLLITTALLAGTASMAYAETGISFSGYGRFGMVYDDNNATQFLGFFVPPPVIVGGVLVPQEGVAVFGDADDDEREIQVSSRLRININATTETDSGVTFGGRIRLQYSSGNSESSISPAYVYGEYNGVRVEVGNANTAYDSAALQFDSEMGFLDRSFGNSQFNVYAFESVSYGGDEDRMGVFASYSVGDLNARISYVTPDQTDDNLPTGREEEISISADYTFGQFTVSGAYASNGAGIEDNELFFIGAAYAINDQANVGLLYFDEDEIFSDFEVIPNGGGDEIATDSSGGRTITLYGNYTFGATTVKAYVADNDGTFNDDLAFGIGADYDLGGARLSGSIQRGYRDQTIADLGVRFDF